jgi:hypothetical protein
METTPMEHVRVGRRRVLKAAGVAGALGVLGSPTAVFASRTGDARVRWDVIKIDFVAGCAMPGGTASAKAEDGSKITVTGSGTFVPGDPDEVTGGGTWRTEGGAVGAASGTYRVTSLVSWEPAPGTFPLPCDKIARIQDTHAGLVELRVAYSNTKRGVLVVSCHYPDTPNSVFEGITTSMGFVDFFNHEEPPAPPVNGNRTTFHVMREED